MSTAVQTYGFVTDSRWCNKPRHAYFSKYGHSYQEITQTDSSSADALCMPNHSVDGWSVRDDDRRLYRPSGGDITSPEMGIYETTRVDKQGSSATEGYVPANRDAEILLYWRPILEKIGKILRLPDNWDSYGGKPISYSTCIRAVEFINSWLRSAKEQGINLPAPQVSPCGNGNIQVEWTIGRRSLEVEIPAKASDPYVWVASLLRGSEYVYSEGEFTVSGEGNFSSTFPLYWLITEK